MTPAVAILMSLPGSALTVSSSRDCDSNAVIRCGALTVNELQRKYNNQSSVRAIFRNFGINSGDIRAMDSTARAGTVTSSGKVIVNGKTVATNAMTAGRQNMAGSHRVTRGGVTFFERRPSVSFASSRLASFVVMDNGRFKFAIIASCGNPVRATSVKKETHNKQVPPPAPTKPQRPKAQKPAPPAPSQSQSQSQSQQQSQSVTVTAPVVKEKVVAAPKPTPAPTPAPAPAPSPTPAPQKGPAEIPNTGPADDLIGLGSFVTLIGGTAHYIYRRRQSI